jgi:hypothetical protein
VELLEREQREIGRSDRYQVDIAAAARILTRIGMVQVIDASFSKHAPNALLHEHSCGKTAREGRVDRCCLFDTEQSQPTDRYL